MWVMTDRAVNLERKADNVRVASGEPCKGVRSGEALEFSDLLEDCCRNRVEENSRFAAAISHEPFSRSAGGVDADLLTSRERVAAVYLANGRSSASPGGWEKYKDDQLLKNPGGDFYDLKRGKIEPRGRKSLWRRLAKNFLDAAGNLENFAANLFGGARRSYRDLDNRIVQGSERGFFGSVLDGIANMGRAFSFGVHGTSAPEGLKGKVKFFFSHMKQALLGDILQGAAGSVVRMAENLALAGWNLIETIPDATIGNFRKGEELTTDVFDNGQVLISYLMDTVPGGEAWARVHASDFSDKDNPGLPVLTNLRKPEREEEDRRWKYVRNTRFRKMIETVGSLGMDVLAVKFLGESKLISEERRDRK
jgi:hypothetical protein